VVVSFYLGDGLIKIIESLASRATGREIKEQTNKFWKGLVGQKINLVEDRWV